MKNRISDRRRKKIFPSGITLEIHAGDITRMDTDVIVNAANMHLAHGGGVAAAIVRRGGQIIQEESRKWVEEHGPINYNQPAFTTAGEMKCKFVIHAVGPVWGEGDEIWKKYLYFAVKNKVNPFKESSWFSSMLGH